MGLIPQRDYFDKDIANSDNTNGYYIIEHDDFVYNPRKSSDAPYGPISRYAYSDAGIVSPLYLCFRAKGNVDTNFFEWYFHSSAWHRYIYMTGDSGARHKRGLHEFVFLKNRKASWEKAALKNIASFCGGGTPSKDISSYWNGNIGWISSSDIQDEWIDDISVTRRITNSAIDNSATKICPKGTIAIVSRVGVGKVAVMPESLCTSQDFTNITSITGNTHYMAYQIAFKMKIEAIKTQGTSIKGVTGDTIKSMVMDIPTLEEQEHIAELLSTFDLHIKRAIRNLDILLVTKKALLQQLFI